jgi:RNA polymerase sigma-70 factor (ECF subfamily)
MLAGTLKRHRFRKEIAETTEHMTDLQQDIVLLQRIAARELHAAYGQRLYAYALRLTDSPTTAEDIVQDTLVAVWQSAGRFRGEGRVLTWLLGIVHHTAMKALRHVSQPISEEMEESLPAPTVSPEEHIQVKEQSQWVRRGLQSLSPEHRAVLELVFYQGLSLNEVAEVCDCPVGTVKSRLSYARKHLRGILSRQEKA